MKRYGILVSLWLVMAVATLGSAQAATYNQHYFNCKNCHKAGVSFTDMGSVKINVCLQCHVEGKGYITGYPLSANPPATLDGLTGSLRAVGDASNHFNKNATPVKQISHVWGVSDTLAEAGAQAPVRTEYGGFYSRYNVSLGKVTCSRCHNPHGEAEVDEIINATGLPGSDGIWDSANANRKLMPRDSTSPTGTLPLESEKVCRACHVQFNIPNTAHATISHPIVANYDAFQSGKDATYQTSAEILANPAQSKVKLVPVVKGGTLGVGCTSCHGPHDVDSDSTTPDGPANRAGLAANWPGGQSDGHLLRSDGPKRTGTGRTKAQAGNTAQLRSNLCQSCHKYKIHAKDGSTNAIGCLDCHGGHSYNGGTSSAYVLKGVSEPGDPIPVRLNRASNGTATDIDYPVFLATGSTRTKWADNVAGSANGYCEKCHGDVNSGAVASADATGEHLPAGLSECTACHKHGDPSFSFANDANAATCGKCHGFPPFKDISGYRAVLNDANDGGWADNKDDIAPSRIGYDQTAYKKNETQAAHKTHAGAHLTAIKDLPVTPDGGGAGEFYFVGTTGIDNCKPCHGNNAGSPAGGHRQYPLATYPNTFRDVIFASISTNGGLTPNYNSAAATCSSVYCHSNGRPRTGDGPTRSIAARTTPAWAGLGTNYAAGGFKSIFGQTQATRCSDCHGYSYGSMSTRSNSAVHRAHLGDPGAGTMGISFECDVCHAETADRATTSKLKANSNDGSKFGSGGGRHVNGTIEVTYRTSGDALATALQVTGSTNRTGSNWDVNTGTCSIYCHDARDTGLSADWDSTTNMKCDDCHGGLLTDTTADGGVGPVATDSHTRHIATTGGGAGLSCDACHGTNASLGTHAGHLDGLPTRKAPGGGYPDICQECHGYEAGEVLPVWGNSSTTDCATCHSGTKTTSNWGALVATTWANVKTTGHNRPSGNYAVSNNVAGNVGCTDCHVTSSTGHFDGPDGDMMLRTDLGFPATYASNKNSFCLNCHGTSPAHPTKAASVATRDINTHQLKNCVACHDPHGSGNINMIYDSQTRQNAKDASSGKFTGNVVFTAVGSQATPLTAANSYDEDDNGIAGYQASSEVNGDDVCATCHTNVGGVTLHNNQQGTDNSAGHYMGDNCFRCHASHTNTTNAFKSGAGSACNSCHDNPPATGAHRNGYLLTDAELHSTTSDHTTSEPRMDCARCHTGADLYTYDQGADVASAVAGRMNHGSGNRVTVLSSSVGYTTSGNYLYCATACHVSSATDGYWFNKGIGTGPATWGRDAALDCNACHYYEASVTGSTNNNSAGARKLQGAHSTHFGKSKQCSACHTVPADTTHISTPTGNDLERVQDKAAATQDEATVLAATIGTGADNDPGTMTCAGSGVALGCHNTKTTPDWISTGITCTNCHDVTGSATADPKTGLHNISAAGVQKHDSTLAGGCTACHNATKPATHGDGIFNNDTAVRTDRFLTVKVGMFVDNASANRGTCSGTGNLTGCHSDSGNWTRYWSTEANSTATTSGSARCNVCHGQYGTLSGSGGLGWNAGTSHYKTLGGAASNRGSTHKSQAGENNACEDCHSFTTLTTNHDTATHYVTMNDDAATVQVTEASGRVYCAYCHTTGDPMASGTYTFSQSVFPIQRVAGANDPKQECNSCHGDGTGRYWPMATYGAGRPENDGGRHEIHMTRLAKAKYNMTVAELLADADVKNKQIFLCQYCHNATVPGQNPGHTDTALPAEVSSTMYALWDATRSTADTVTYTGTGANGTGTCANANCHNNKNTNSVANFTWHGTGTQNCLLCHNDITVTTGGTTGATHAAHTGSAATFGKNITCASCHGGSVTWSPYVVPDNGLHINGTFNVGTAGGSGVPFTYGGTYTDAATRTVGDCSINLCHNDGKNAVSYRNGGANYNWQTAFTGCTACHRTDVNLGGNSHTAHLTGTFATTFGKTAVCADCHDAVSASSMAGKTAHMDGAVTLAAGLTYSGTPNSLSVTVATTYGSCTGSCHTNGKGSAPATLATWNTTYTNCNICHLAPNTAGNDGARHVKHVGNTAKLPASCGECHLNATATTYNSANHLNATVNTGNKITAHTNGTATCTNNCHIVNAARGDWLDTAALGCTDCHVAGSYLASSNLPTSGLHTGTLTISANTHDDQFKNTKAEVAPGTATCVSCHTATPSTAHINGTYTTSWNAAPPSINFAAEVGFTDGTTPTCGPNGALVNCHDDDGVWKRKWSTTAQNSNGTECANCHGDFTAGFTTGVVARHQTTTSGDADGQVGSSHDGTDKCYTCHNYKAGSTTYYNFATKHRDGAIQLNSNATVVDNGATVGCSGCHSASDGTADEQHVFVEASGVRFSRALEAGPAAGCNSCHGGDYAAANNLNYWPGAAGASAPDRAGEHNAHMIKLVAKLGYNMAALTDGQQKQMCAYCHPYSVSIGESGHGDASPSEVGSFDRIMDGLPDTGTVGSYTPGNGTGGSCAAVDCHNSKTTPATHEWYDGAASACIMCHNDITDTTAGTTGATHAAHTGSAATFGKTINCASCHGAATSWAGNTPPATLHIDGTFQVGTAGGSGVPFTYGGTYTNAATRTVGDCSINLCHNDGKNAVSYRNGGANYNWQTAFTGCTACHRTDVNLGGNSHTAHLTGTFATTFGKTAVCADCHDAVSASSMAGKTAHMDGAVTLAAGLTYSGTPNSLSVTVATTYGSCTGSCHTNGKGSAPATLATWNTTYTNCNICHLAPNTAGNDGARHVKHVGNTAKLPASCGECHLNATATTYNSANHLNATVNTGNKITAHTNGTATCTNNCHIVNAARGDWLDTAALGCTDCHVAGSYLASSNLPTSGLHTGTLTISANTHDDQFKNTKAEVAPGTATCVSCHTATPSTAHINGTYTTSWNAAPPSINFAAEVGFTDGTTPTCGPNGALVNCHDDDGVWKRKWSTTAQNSNGTECGNCHGDFTTGFTTGVVARHQTTTSGDADGQVASSHNGTDKCYTCHNYKAGDTTYYNFATKHRDGAIQINSSNSFTDNGTTVGCGACHAGNDGTADEQHAFAEASGVRFTRALESGPSAGCNTCHGVGGAGGFWPIKATDDAGTADDMNQAGAHPQHVLEIAKKLYATQTPSVAEQNTTCNYCHPANNHGGADGVLPADVNRTDTANDGTPDLELATPMKKIIGGGNDSNGFWRRTPGTCSNVACHASAPFTPHWYADTVVPAAITNLANVTGTEPGTVNLTWTAPGDDGSLDGTAYRYDLRYSTAPITAGNFDAASQGPVPTVRRRNQAQTIDVKGLVPGTTYYFAVKTYDEAGNVSAISNLPAGVVAKTDTQAPVFNGISAVSANDYSLDLTPNPDTNSVNVSWEAGRDHSHSLTTPLNYLVLWSEYSLRTHFANGGPMPTTIGTDTCFDKSKTGAALVNTTCGTVTPASNEYRVKSAQTTALNYDVPALPVGTVYNFLVRAKDQAGNVDSNRVELMAMARNTPFQTIALQTQLTSAQIPSSSTGWTGLPGGTTACNAALGASYPGTAPGTFTMTTNVPVVWSPATPFSVKTNVWGLNYQIKITGNTNGSSSLTYQFGYLTGQAFTSFGTARTMTISRRAPARVVKFPLSSFKGMVPNGSKPAFVLVNTTATNTVTLTYGSTANKGGILLFNQQEFNDLPTGLGSLSQSDVASTFIGGNLKRLTWSAASAVNGGQSVHYDVFASINGGTSYPYTVARGLTTTTVDWDPVGDGITGNQTNVKFKVLAGDGFREGAMLVDGSNANNENHSMAESTVFSVNNSGDIWTPAAIGSAAGTADDLKVETRPKQGAVNLSWKAVGNDGFNHGTKATVYDIRFSTSNIPDGATFDALPVQNRATNEPKPDFTGAVESFELLGLNADQTYYFAMKVGDDAGNWSPLSNVVSTAAGPKCGICHSTPPDETATAGNHVEHGYTMNDCANCHGNDPTTGAHKFTTSHQDGELKLGWKAAIAYKGIQSGTRLYYTVDGTPTGAVIYDDNGINLSYPAGGGGFFNTGGDQVDNGRCMNFSAANANGCHGPATPDWVQGLTLACSACHGTGSRTTDQYSRNFDATIDNGMVVPDQVKASPAVDNRGGGTGKYVGAHLKHLNSSFRLAKGDNCALCHKDFVHADGTVDVAYDLSVTGAGALWTPNATGAGTPGTCAGTSVENCHGSNTPSWDSAATVACNQCHGFNGSNPTHVTDASIVRACTWCHPAGHPQGTVQDTSSIMIPNSPLVGIAYRSGGIHLLKNINSRGAKTTEAEICWTCHDAQVPKITEWGTNIDSVTGSSPYNYGDIFTDVGFGTATSNWLGAGTGAYWRSGTSQFQTIKKGKIQSTHSTKQGGTSAVAWDATNLRYNETPDGVADLRCSNCHDVHNMNKAPNDTATGTPYLRGTWMGNPYNEDGPPLSTTTYLNVAIGSYGFGAVPRGGTGYRQLGGYFIDQNNVVPMTASTTSNATLDDYPTAGWTNQSSAGLCILCHSDDVDNMDQNTGENLWVGTNGHSNSAIGGTFSNSASIFVNLTGGLTGLPTSVFTTSKQAGTQVPDMAYQMQPNSPSTTRGYGYRGTTGTSNAGNYTPVTATLYAHYAYDWGATVSNSNADIDQMYHQFSCSKCHNPHASRLPKLLITNCLDIQHNTWDDNKSVQSAYTAAALDDVDRFGGTGQRSAYYASAQNCHRYNNLRTAANKGGWNKVSIWTNANQ